MTGPQCDYRLPSPARRTALAAARPIRPPSGTPVTWPFSGPGVFVSCHPKTTKIRQTKLRFFGHGPSPGTMERRRDALAGGSAGIGIPEDLPVDVVHRGERSVLCRLLCPRTPVVRGLDLAHRGVERGAVEIRADIAARAGGIPELAPAVRSEPCRRRTGRSPSRSSCGGRPRTARCRRRTRRVLRDGTIAAARPPSGSTPSAARCAVPGPRCASCSPAPRCRLFRRVRRDPRLPTRIADLPALVPAPPGQPERGGALVEPRRPPGSTCRDHEGRARWRTSPPRRRWGRPRWCRYRARSGRAASR